MTRTTWVSCVSLLKSEPQTPRGPSLERDARHPSCVREGPPHGATSAPDGGPVSALPSDGGSVPASRPRVEIQPYVLCRGSRNGHGSSFFDQLQHRPYRRPGGHAQHLPAVGGQAQDVCARHLCPAVRPACDTPLPRARGCL